MGSLFRFLIRYHVFIVFLFLQGVSLFLLSRTTYYQESVLMANADAIKGRVFGFIGEQLNYISLREENQRLAVENTALRNELNQLISADSTFYHQVQNKNIPQSYIYISAKVVNNSTNKRNNYFIINVGSKQGVVSDMGVISADGVVGTVERVSENFSTVMSLLNTTRELSAMLKKTGHYGPLVWDGKSVRSINLVEIPQHVPVEIGDTVVTSSHSGYFPEGIMIGTVSSFEIIKGTYIEAKVALSNDFRSLRYVDVIKSLHHEEILDHTNGIEQIQRSTRKTSTH